MPSLLFAIVLFTTLVVVTAVDNYVFHRVVEGIGLRENFMLGAGFTAVYAFVAALGYWLGSSARRRIKFSVIYSENPRAVVSGLIAAPLIFLTFNFIPELLSEISTGGRIVVAAGCLLVIGGFLAWIPLPLRKDKQSAA